MKRYTFFCTTIWSLFVFSSSLFAQELVNSGQEEEYYTSYADLLLLRVYMLAKSSAVGIKKGEERILLEPNGTISLGGGFNFKSFGFNLGFGLPASNESNRKFGTTKRLDIQASVYSQKIGVEGYFQAYNGYYNSNPQDFIEWNNDSFPRVPGMKVLSTGAAGFYLFNHARFSYRAAFVRNEIQNRSAGSFTLPTMMRLRILDLYPRNIPIVFAPTLTSNHLIPFHRGFRLVTSIPSSTKRNYSSL